VTVAFVTPDRENKITAMEDYSCCTQQRQVNSFLREEGMYSEYCTVQFVARIGYQVLEYCTRTCISAQIQDAVGLGAGLTLNDIFQA
jgi:hypothetical protein